MANDMMVKELEQVVVRFSGDSGDGMQLAGNIFSTVSATVGNDISTFPDYPADIRAPQVIYATCSTPPYSCAMAKKSPIWSWASRNALLSRKSSKRSRALTSKNF